MPWIDLVGAGSILLGVAVLVLLYRSAGDRDVPGARGFTILLLGSWLWLVGYGLALLAASLVDPVRAYNVVLLGASLASIGAFLFVVEYAYDYVPSRRLLVGLLVVPAVTQLLAWTNPLHRLVWAAGTEPLAGGGVERVYGPLFYVPHAAFSYGLVFVAIALLASHALRSHGMYRRRSGLLLFTFLLVSVVNLVNVTVGLGDPRIDPGPFAGALFVGVVWRIRSKYGFLDVAPVVRARTVDRMRDGMLAIDDDGRILDANDAALSFLGVDGSSIARAVVGDPIDAYRPALVDALPSSTDGDRKAVTTVAGADGEGSYELNASPLPVGPERTGWLVTIRDVTERERRKRDLRRQNERLERFASVVSHDLRNPLHTATGYLDLAEETGEMEHVATARRSLDRMHDMIDGLLAMTRADDAADRTERLRLARVVTDAWETSRTEGATLRSDVDDAVEIEANPDLIGNVFENLFRNAATHNDPPVTVRVGTLPDGKGFYVEDDGDGIPVDDRETVFEQGYTTGSGGTGFGLSIVREIVEAHGWSIAIEEGEDGGARFEIVTGRADA